MFLLLSGKIEVELQSDGQNYVKEIEPLSRFWIPEGNGPAITDSTAEAEWNSKSICLLQFPSLPADVTYSIHNVDRVPAELVYFRLRQQ